MKKYDYAYKGDPQEFVRRVSAIPNLEPEEEERLITKWQEECDEAARDMLLAAHQKLLVRMVLRKNVFINYFEDGIQIANQGLLVAIDKYDATKGARLGTYARWWVRAQLNEFTAKNMTIKINLYKNGARIDAKLHKALYQVNGGLRSPTLEDFEKAASLIQMGMGGRALQEMYGVIARPVSLDQPFTQEEDSQALIDTIADDAPSPEDVVAAEDRVAKARAHLTAAMERLSERERDIFMARHLSDDPQTLADLADKYGISRERVRQIEVKAFNNVAHYIRVHHPGWEESLRQRAVSTVPQNTP